MSKKFVYVIFARHYHAESWDTDRLIRAYDDKISAENFIKSSNFEKETNLNSEYDIYIDKVELILN